MQLDSIQRRVWFKNLYEFLNENVLNHRFFTGVYTFLVEQNKKTVIDAMNGLYKRSEATSVSTLDFSTLYTRFQHG